jgi:hypothetical protein
MGPDTDPPCHRTTRMATVQLVPRLIEVWHCHGYYSDGKSRCAGLATVRGMIIAYFKSIPCASDAEPQTSLLDRHIVRLITKPRSRNMTREKASFRPDIQK